ncbi:AAA family ATPase [uncultured Thiocystis sp.]|jgi:type II secretory pathway predicted ATPase ExeA/outer membrane protein OmpA-like peptidoglycan-associated protein|uniref:AAA family ATPase n=1 Tax=uncultured Thiocystis sp. TaxID=1202134 RepID=UPI0025CE34DE|nr:AAA family ATPase [uncultured Thiocystis sp.]
MYESFFNLREKPFSLLPDPSFLFMSDQHQQALTLLEYGLLNQAGFMILTGEIGSGKTTLMRYLLTKLDTSYTVGLISNTHQSLGDLMDWVCMALDIQMGNATKLEKYRAFVDFIIDKYAKGQRVLLIVDEAQNLGIETLEELRLLSNINSDKDLVLQLMLLGQPQLRDLLHHPDLEQFAQRVASSYHLGRIGLKETENYIRHRIIIAGGTHEIFSQDACEAIHHYSKGIPRVINLICDTALVYAYGAGERFITSESIDELIRTHMPNLIISIDSERIVRQKPETHKPSIGNTAANAINAIKSNEITITSAISNNTASGQNTTTNSSDIAPKLNQGETLSPLNFGIAPHPLTQAPKSLGSTITNPIPPTRTPFYIAGEPQSRSVFHANTAASDQKQNSIGAKLKQQEINGSHTAPYKKLPLAAQRIQKKDSKSPNRMLPVMSVLVLLISLGIASIWLGDSPISDSIRERISNLLKVNIKNSTEPTSATESISNPSTEAVYSTTDEISQEPLKSPSTLMNQQSHALGTLSSSQLENGQGQGQGQGQLKISSSQKESSTDDFVVSIDNDNTQNQLETKEQVTDSPNFLKYSEQNTPQNSSTENQGIISQIQIADNDKQAILPIVTLENQLSQLTVSIEKLSPKHLTANLGSLVQFKDGSAALPPEAQRVLSQIAGILKKSREIHLKVISHTDSSGSISLNQSLSDRRAKVVADYLVNSGIPIEQVEYEGRGKSEMKVAPNQENKIGAWVNRRIEIELYDKNNF